MGTAEEKAQRTPLALARPTRQVAAHFNDEVEVAELLRCLEEQVSSSSLDASAILSSLEGLLIRRVGTTDLSMAIPAFVARYRASRIDAKTISDLYTSVQTLQDQGLHLGQAQLSPRTLSKLRAFIRWYSRRCLVLRHLEHKDDPNDKVFFPRVVHGALSRNAYEHEIATSFEVLNRADQLLWMVVTLEDDSQAIGVRQGWESWSASASAMGEKFGASSQAFVSLCPFVADGMRVVVDDVRCRIPVGALQLSSGKHQLRARIALADSRGNMLGSTNIPFGVSVSAAVMRQTPKESPQSLGFWSCDPISHAEIDLSEVTLRPVESSGRKIHNLYFKTLLSNAERLPELVRLECRFFTTAGEAVLSNFQELAERHGQFCDVVHLASVDRTLTRREVLFEIPAAALALSSQRKEPSPRLWVEVLVRTGDCKVLCGARRELSLPAHQSTDQEIRFLREQRVFPRIRTENDLGLSLASCEVRAQQSFKDTPAIRISALVEGSQDLMGEYGLCVDCIDSRSKRAGRVYRELWVVGDGKSHRLVFHLGYTELETLLDGSESEDLKLVARFSLINEEGTILGTNKIPFSVGPHEIQQGGLLRPQNSPSVSDIVVHAEAFGDIKRCSLSVNMHSQKVSSQHFAVYGEMVNKDDEPLTYPDGELLPGVTGEFDFRRKLEPLRHRSVWAQEEITLFPQGDWKVSEPAWLKLVLLNSDGKLHEVIRHPVGRIEEPRTYHIQESSVPGGLLRKFRSRLRGEEVE